MSPNRNIPEKDQDDNLFEKYFSSPNRTETRRQVRFLEIRDQFSELVEKHDNGEIDDDTYHEGLVRVNSTIITSPDDIQQSGIESSDPYQQFFDFFKNKGKRRL